MQEGRCGSPPLLGRDLFETAWRLHGFQQFLKDLATYPAQVARNLKSSELIAIMNRLLRDFNANRRGLPDLFLARDGRPLFVEVKAKGEETICSRSPSEA